MVVFELVLRQRLDGLKAIGMDFDLVISFHVSSGDIKKAVGINVKYELDSGLASEGWLNSVQNEVA